MTDLLPCPFCGDNAKRHDVEAREDVDNAGASYIECSRCGACTQLHFDRKENLVSSWNDRISAPAQPALDRKLLHLAAKEGNLKFWRDSEAQRSAFTAWRTGGYVGDCPELTKGTIVDYITDAIIAALSQPSPAAAVETGKCTGLCNDGSGEGCNCSPAAHQRLSAGSARVIFPEEDWPQRDCDLADWFNGLTGKPSEDDWISLMAVLSIVEPQAAPDSALTKLLEGIESIASSPINGTSLQQKAQRFDLIRDKARAALALSRPQEK